MDQIIELLNPWVLRETGYRHVDCRLLSPQQSVIVNVRENGLHFHISLQFQFF